MTATASAESNGQNALPEGPGMHISPELTAETPPATIVSLRSATNPAPETRIPAFSIDGAVYSVLTQPRVNQAMRYVHLSRTQGSESAVDFMLEVLLGKDGHEALLAFDDLTEADLEAVITACSRIMTGAIENPKDKPSNGSARSRG